MNNTQELILDNIQVASNQVHEETMMGDADVVFVSRRVMDEIEPVMDADAFEPFTIVEGSGWLMDAAPSDIRAITHMGKGRMEMGEVGVGGVPSMEFVETEKENVATCNITLDDEHFS